MDPVLLTVGRTLADGDFGTPLEKLAADMFLTMDKAGGLGLAAPQRMPSDM